MARTRTLAQMRTEALQLADMENSNFVGTSTGGEVDRYINEGIAALWDLLIDHQGQEWVLSSGTLSIVAGTDTYTLPTTCFLVKGVDLTDSSGNEIPMRPYMFDERHKYQDGAWNRAQDWGWFSQVAYRLLGSVNVTTGVYTPQIRFIPEPLGSHTVTVWYIPHAPILDSDSDVWDGFNGWEEYPTVYAAARLLEKEESDPSHLYLRMQKLEERIKSLATARDLGYPERVQDLEDAW